MPSFPYTLERWLSTVFSWAYVRVYGGSQERELRLEPFIERYNFTRPHGSLGKKPPASCLTNVVGNHS